MMFIARAARRHLLRFLIGAGMLVPSIAAAHDTAPRIEVRPAAVLPRHASHHAELALMAARARHAPLSAFAPAAWPEALPEGQATDVKFTVLLAGGAASVQPKVTLHIRGLDTSVPMRDDGTGADLSAGDRIYSAVVRFSAAAARAGRCYDASASVLSARGQTVLSGERRVCVSQFTVGLAASDLSATNIIGFSDGGVSGRVLADEVLIRVRAGLGEDRVDAAAALVGGRIVGALPGEGVYQIRLSAPQTAGELRQTLRRLGRVGGVLLAAPNTVGELQAPPVVPVTPSDPDLATQWGLDRVKAREAWAITTGDPAMLIAVIDSGVDFDHPDFWATPGGTDTRFAISGADIVAADCTGAGCVAVSTPATCHATNTCNVGNAATDTYGHGTLVSGFVGAATNNALGVAGATWQGRLLTVRYAVNGTVTAAKLLDGINYARGQGARILSISSALVGFSAGIICPAVTTADTVEGRLVVAAAGNDGGTGNNYPAACTSGVTPVAMPVANSEVDGSNLDVIHTGTLPSNYGTWVSLAAPGTAVPSTARTAAACPTCDPAYVSATGYAMATGTSFSTPLASGGAALVLARSPATTNADLRTLLYSTGVALQAPAAHIRRIDLLAALLTFNVAPTSIGFPGTCIPENTNTAAGVSVGSLSTVDADTGLTTHEYTVVGGADAAKFSIGGVNADQLLITDGVLNFEAKPSYAVRVRSTDVGNLFVEQDLVVGVCNINEAPVVATPTFAIPENSPAATAVGTVVASDPEGGALSFAITAGNTGGAFAISGAGAITVVNSGALDFETTPSFALTVSVSDGVNTTLATTTVNLTNVNEPPTISGATFSIPENSPAATVVGTVIASDPDSSLAFAITAGNTGGAFAISAAGVISVLNSAALDFETSPAFVLTVTASDGVTTVPATVIVNLTDVSESIPNPILVFDRKETGTDAFANTVDRYFFTVANFAAYPAAMFAARPDLPPCGLNNAASRTWVDFFRSDNNDRIYGFCALGTPSDLNGIWFGIIPSGATPPPAVYIKLMDRETGIEYQSNSVVVPFP